MSATPRPGRLAMTRRNPTAAEREASRLARETGAVVFLPLPGGDAVQFTPLSPRRCLRTVELAEMPEHEVLGEFNKHCG